MKILGISAPPRKEKSNTYFLLKKVLSVMQKEGAKRKPGSQDIPTFQWGFAIILAP